VAGGDEKEKEKRVCALCFERFGGEKAAHISHSTRATSVSRSGDLTAMTQNMLEKNLRVLVPGFPQMLLACGNTLQTPESIFHKLNSDYPELGLAATSGYVSPLFLHCPAVHFFVRPLFLREQIITAL
jgi:hypothetical protein